jgi:microcystin-dependent protein
MDEVYIGSIQLFAFNYAPAGFALCNGATLQIMQNQALYALIGIKYGGNGTSNFMLPNLLNASPYPTQNMQYYIATQGMYPTQQ